jgi:hypothetical protein
MKQFSHSSRVLIHWRVYSNWRSTLLNWMMNSVMRLHEIVSEAYGSVVAMAALRGRLLVEDSPMLQADGEERTLAQVLGGDPIDVTSSGGEQTQPVEALLVEENSQESLTFAEVVISENITASVDEAIELDTAVEVVEVSTSDAFVEVQSAIGEQAIFIEDASEISASTATELEEEPQEEIGPGIESAFSTDTENAQLDDPWEGSPLEKETTPQEATVASVNLSKTDWTFGSRDVVTRHCSDAPRIAG